MDQTQVSCTAGRFFTIWEANINFSSRNSLQNLVKEFKALCFGFVVGAHRKTWGFPGGAEVKSPPANAGDWVRFLGWEDPLEKEMATHSSILAWRIPWTEEPGGLQSTGSQRVRHD